MNVTESNNVSILIRAIQGDPNIDPDTVIDAAFELQGRIKDALGAAPDVIDGLVLANTMLLQADTAADQRKLEETDVVFIPDGGDESVVEEISHAELADA